MKISVVTATWNCRSTVGDTLTSVAGQTYADVEHVFVDGASSDGTVDFLREKMRPGSVLISESDLGIYDALNKGIGLAKGDVIGFLHADDVFASKEVLQDVATAFRDPDVDIVYGDLNYVDKLDLSIVLRRWVAGPFSQVKLQRGWMPPHPTVYVRREVYAAIGGFSLAYRIGADYEFLIRLLSGNCFKVHYIPKTMVLMRSGGVSNKDAAAIIRKTIEDWRTLRSSGQGHVGAARCLLLKNLSKVSQLRPSGFWRRASRRRGEV